MRARCYERFAQLQADRETTQAKIDALGHAPARDDATLLDELPLLADTTDLLPECIQAAPYIAINQSRSWTSGRRA